MGKKKLFIKKQKKKDLTIYGSNIYIDVDAYAILVTTN